MTGKADIADHVVATVEGLTKKDATELVRAVFDTIASYLQAGEKVDVPGFGSFTVTQRAARKGRNPATGETISIKASKSVRFKAFSALKSGTGSTGPRRR